MPPPLAPQPDASPKPTRPLLLRPRLLSSTSSLGLNLAGLPPTPSGSGSGSYEHYFPIMSPTQNTDARSAARVETRSIPRRRGSDSSMHTASTSAAAPAVTHVSASAETVSRSPAGWLASCSRPSKGTAGSKRQPSVGVSRSSAGFMPGRAAASKASTQVGGGNVYMPRSESASDRLSGMLQAAGSGTTPSSPTMSATGMRRRKESGASSQSLPFSSTPKSPASIDGHATPTTGPTQAVHAGPQALARGEWSESQVATSTSKITVDALAQAAPSADPSQRGFGGKSSLPFPSSSFSSTTPTSATSPSSKRAKNLTTHVMAAHRSATPSPASSAQYTSATSDAGSAYRTPPRSPPGAPSPRPTHARARSSRKDQAENKGKGSHWLPIGVADTESEIELNDVDAPSTAVSDGSTVTVPTASMEADSSSASASPTLNTYVPPYEARKVSLSQSAATSSVDLKSKSKDSSVDLKLPSKKDLASTEGESLTPQRYALTFTASLSSGSEVFALSRRRLELELLWNPSPDPSLWDYVPGSRYVPAWTLRAAGAKSGQVYEEGMIRWAVGYVPVLGGAVKAWL